jgi:hypothetical protein
MQFSEAASLSSTLLKLSSAPADSSKILYYLTLKHEKKQFDQESSKVLDQLLANPN